jgi:hypothetical protein
VIGSLGRVTRLDGIAFGAGPAFLLRELVLFQADFRRTDWFQCGGPAPRADPPSGATFDWVSPAEWEVRADAMATAPAVAAQRFQGGAPGASSA